MSCSACVYLSAVAQLTLYRRASMMATCRPSRQTIRAPWRRCTYVHPSPLSMRLHGAADVTVVQARLCVPAWTAVNVSSASHVPTLLNPCQVTERDSRLSPPQKDVSCPEQHFVASLVSSVSPC